MPYLLTTPEFLHHYGDEVQRICADTGLRLDPLTLPGSDTERIEPSRLAEIEVACFTGNFEDDPAFTRRFLGSALHAPNLRWMHLPNAGIDHPVFGRLLKQGVRLTTSSGAGAEPIAQSAIGGLLALARGFPHWASAQRRHEWAPLRGAHTPHDLRGQTMLLIGVGGIGQHIGRLGRALGLYVIGIRRSPRTSDDQVDELSSPSMLPTLLARADWLVLACPLTDDTRRLIDAAALARLRPGAYLINVARGQVVDEAAVIAALTSGQLAGAYLDVFEEEPLPAASPLWNLPNVIVSPHNCGASRGTATRVSELFLRNLAHWGRQESLENEVRAS